MSEERNFTEWGGHRWTWPQMYGGLYIYHRGRQGLILGYNDDLQNWLVRWEDNKEYAAYDKDYIHSRLYHQ